MDIRLPEFNALMALHQQDPEAFEEFRRHVLREAVDSAPQAHHASLERLLVRIEEARAAAATPMDAAVAASRMMQQSLGEMLGCWTDLHHVVAGAQTTLILERFRR